MSELTTHEVLVAARNRIGRFGWGYVDEHGCDAGKGDCASNAIIEAASWEDGVADRAHDALCDVLGLPLGERGEVWCWNDAPGRTKTEVLAAFDRAIAATAPSPADPFESGESEIKEVSRA